MISTRRARYVRLELAVLALLWGACTGPEPTASPDAPSIFAAKGGTANGKGGGGSGDTSLPDPTVDAVAPTFGPQGATLDVTVIGTNFDDGSTVEFLLAGHAADIATNSTTFQSETELTANITIDAMAEEELYDVEVTTRRKKKGIGAELFEVRKGNPSDPATPLTAEALTGIFTAVGDPVYTDGEGAGVRLAGVNGNLMFNVRDFERMVHVLMHDAAGTVVHVADDVDRIFTNRTADIGSEAWYADGLRDVAAGASAETGFEARFADGTALRFGYDCGSSVSGSGQPTPGNRVSVTRSADGTTWTLSGSNGVWCVWTGHGKNATPTVTPIPDSFSMELHLIP